MPAVMIRNRVVAAGFARNFDGDDICGFLSFN